MFIWPAQLFNPRQVTVRPVEMVISGGTSLSGEEDIISTDGGGRMEISMDGIALRTPAQIRAWEAWSVHLAAGKVDVLVPLLSLYTANRPSHGRGLMTVSKIVADDPVWPTQVSVSSPQIVATIAADAAVRSSQVAISVGKGAPLSGGEKFSVGNRAYKIGRPLGGNLFQIWPPLREAVIAGAACEFDWPRVKCRSVPGESFAPALDFGRRSEVSIRFLENAA